MEDVVDEWNTELIKSAIQKEEEENADNAPVMKKKQVCPFIPSPSCCFSQVDKLARRHDIAHKIKELNEILDEIAKGKDRYHFQLTNDPAPRVVERPRTQTTSFVDMSEICGRDSFKDDLVGMLLGKGSEEERSPHLISLVGMGGIGKTTLAQLAYNDPKVQAHFEIKAWVCVSDPFDQCKVAKEILESIKAQSFDLTALQGLLERICDKVRGNKFFLVFDDVWTEDYAMWKPFRDALKNCGSQNSRILVTTRKEKVAKMMESANMIKLKELSKEDCWSMFSQIAFANKDPQQREQLEDLGKKISKKCKGLPLAARTLGSLMCLKKSKEEWMNVLNSNLWELEDVERGLFAPLLLSYYDLSSPLKRCFSYCAVFPKDHFFDIDELVSMWIAHGFVESKGNMEMEIMAREYFEDLVIRSFFQEFRSIDNEISYKMHDIVNDFAQSITKARHLRFSTATQFPPSTYSAKNLRTIIIFDQSYYMSNLFKDFKCLRVLTLKLQMELPDTMENLIHLRYLDLHFDTYMELVLPETICNLCNLQFLKIYKPKVLLLPQGIGKLINLRHLTGGEFVVPRGIGRLISLRTLNCVNLSDEDSKRCKFGEFKKLIHLRDLYLNFGKDGILTLKDLRIESNLSDVLILNALEPPQTLEKLHISCYRGNTMSPIWLTSLTNLEELYLQSAVDLMSLPPLGKIPCLELLTIESAWRLKKVGVEFMGIESENKKEDIKIFPNLEYLEFSCFWDWEEWIGGTRERGKEDEDCITIMPRLQKLIIRCCTKLKSLPDFLRTTPLKELEIAECPIIKKRCQRETGEDWPNISHIPIIKLID
ncbi:hypothetical protein SO802_014014 [Lithocarpus litseifolius]|uniref:NB-ARC domain-containing protein n=1 Tax=Lithocarpus litseifolius TaxID=425828 RepID=A0AAW2D776_9ROSI